MHSSVRLQRSRYLLKFRIVLLLLFILVSTASHSRADKPLIWGFASFPPYLDTQSNGQPFGLIADIVKNTFAHAGVEYLPFQTPNKRTRKVVNQGFVDFSIGPMTAVENPDNFYRSQGWVAKIELRSYWIGEQPPVTQASDLIGQSVVLISSYHYSGLRNFVENPSNNVFLALNVEDHGRALIALSLKRATYMLGYRQPTDLMQLEMKILNLHSFSLNETYVYFFIHKSVKNGQQIMDKLDKSFAELYPNNINQITND